MILQSYFSSLNSRPHLFCPCNGECHLITSFRLRRRRKFRILVENPRRPVAKSRFLACSITSRDSGNIDYTNSARNGAKNFLVARFSNEFEDEDFSQESSIEDKNNSNKFTDFREDPMVDKLRTQLGAIHPIPSPPINKNVAALFVFFFFVGVVFDKVWTSTKRWRQTGKEEGQREPWPQVPTSFSLFLEKDLQRKESVEWVNMVLGKLWKVYRGGIENWIIGLLQPVIDNLKKPDYVQRVEIKQFSLGDEPLSVRNVERRTSRRVNDLQYQIGLRYTGGARMLLMLSLRIGIIPIVVPVGVQDFDIDGELWVKLRLIPTEPWVGAVSWAFVSLPKIKFELSPFYLFNLMAIPVLSKFLTKLLTEDLPRLFVRPKKIVLDFQKAKAVRPLAENQKPGDLQEGNKNFVGELSVTLVDARKLPYMFSGKTDPYVILRLGDQSIRSKKNSQTTVIGPPGKPIWNQDFQFLVENPRSQKLQIEVNDSLGFSDLAIGTGEVDLGSLKDTVPTDRVVNLSRGWKLFGKDSAGELLLRLTYKAYVEDEEDDRTEVKSTIADTTASDDELSDSDEQVAAFGQNVEISSNETVEESFMDVLSALIVSEEFQGIVSSEAGNSKLSDGDLNSVTSSTLNMNSNSAGEDLDEGSRANEGVSSKSGTNSNSVAVGSDKDSEGSRESALLWFGVITGILVLIAINMGGSGFFNP